LTATVEEETISTCIFEPETAPASVEVSLSIVVSSATPQPLGTASAGVSGQASRADHVHAMPSAADVDAIVEATTAAGFPATGTSQTLYIGRDVSRVYRWDSSGVYIEIGT
jgi:hypothetical protein